MNRKKELISLILGDFFAIVGSWFLFYFIRFKSGLFVVTSVDLPHIFQGSLVVYVFWLMAFLFFGLYRSWYVRPIFDEMVTVLKTLLLGTLAFMIIVLWDPITPNDTRPFRNDPRILGLVYFGCVSVLMLSVRLLIRYTQRRFLEAGIGLRPVIIVGDTVKAEQLAGNISKAKRIGYQVLGYVNTNGQVPAGKSGLKQLGSYDSIEQVIEQHKVKEVLIALNSGEHEKLLDIMGRLSDQNVGMKIVPDLYDIVSGQVRTREIHGIPLIDINPELMRPWEEVAKRLMDVSISGLVVLFGSPVWLIIALAVKLSSRGPVIYSQDRVGLNGGEFRMYKFRSMAQDAEKSGVPQWAQKNDPRVTPLGKFLRKSHLDEVPQFWNVLKGDMSLVGPRPERDFFVNQLTKELPYYKRRLKVRPGITGLYQAMVDKYDESMDDVKNRLKYDLMYIESMSFRLDLKILFRTAYMMMKGKGQA